MSEGWQEQRERGTSSMLRLIAWIGLNLGRGVGRVLLYPICVYFLATTPEARAASRRYLATILGRRARLREVYRHYLTFSQVILDRAFFLVGRLDEFDISVHGRETIDAILEEKAGCILLGAHMGSFEALRALGTFERRIPLKILIYPDNSKRFLAILGALNPELAREVIPLGRPGTMLSAKRHVEAGGVVGLLGDRIAKGEKVVSSTFLGQTANFPAGPLVLASVLKVPVVIFSGLYLGGDRYEIRFELLADDIDLDPQARTEDLQPWIDRYARFMEGLCRRAPYNWFNFYDFWDLSGGAKRVGRQ